MHEARSAPTHTPSLLFSARISTGHVEQAHRLETVICLHFRSITPCLPRTRWPRHLHRQPQQHHALHLLRDAGEVQGVPGHP